MAENDETKKGLQCLDDEALTTIVENELQEQGELKSYQAIVAFNELERRTPK